MARTISDVVCIERAEETFEQHDQDTGELVAVPTAQQPGPSSSRTHGKRTSTRVNVRPDKPLSVHTTAAVYDDGRLPPASNDNKPPSQYPLKDMATRQELGDNEFENRRNWANAELFRIHRGAVRLAIARAARGLSKPYSRAVCRFGNHQEVSPEPKNLAWMFQQRPRSTWVGSA
jgi:hypothetical protein